MINVALNRRIVLLSENRNHFNRCRLSSFNGSGNRTSWGKSMMMMNDKTYCRVNVSSSKIIMIDRRLFTPLHKTRSRSISGGSSLLSKKTAAREHYHQQQEDDNDNDDNDSLDSLLLCQKHIMELPTQEFAMGCNLLHQIAMGSFEWVTSFLTDYPAMVNFRDYDRRTPLHVAASEGHLKLCRFLVTHSAKINRSDRWGGSPLDDAHRHRHVEVMKFLKTNGAVFGSPLQSHGFITAAAEGDLEELKTLFELSEGALLNKGDNDRRTALHLAAGEGQADICEFLCAAGADVNVRDVFGNTPLDDALISSSSSYSSRNKNSDIIIENDNNTTECIRILKKHGAQSGESSGGSDKDEDVLLDLMQEYGKIRENGLLSMDWQDVKSLLEGIGKKKKLTDAFVQKQFEVIDLDGDGLIYCRDFIANSDIFLGGRPAGIVLLVGGPGSGKGVLSERLAKECGLVHLSSGDLLRNEIVQGTALGEKVEKIMKAGKLVSSAIMVTLMKKVMKDHPGKRILLDGFPRSRENAQDLVELCGKPELALHLNCDDTIMMERIMKRSQEGVRPGQQQKQERVDDNFHTALQRIRTHHKYSNVTLEFLREQHVPIVFLDGSVSTAEGVWKQLSAIGRMMRPAVKRRPPRK